MTIKRIALGIWCFFVFAMFGISVGSYHVEMGVLEAPVATLKTIMLVLAGVSVASVLVFICLTVKGTESIVPLLFMMVSLTLCGGATGAYLDASSFPLLTLQFVSAASWFFTGAAFATVLVVLILMIKT